MKKYITFCLALFMGLASKATTNTAYTNFSDSTQIVKTACGECIFGKQGAGCQLAIKIKGKVYFVEGTTIADHGDEHAEDGFCNTQRKAKVSGKIVGNKFIATSFELIKNDKK
jgi:hypothetical protein